MKIIIYRIWQCTWGILQTLLGLIMFLIHFKSKHFSYHGAIITEWNVKSSMSLGLFVFVTSDPYFAPKYEGQISANELSNRLLVHEYGHTIQSLILGPLYLIIIVIPSTLWGFMGRRNARMSKSHMVPFSQRDGQIGLVNG